MGLTISPFPASRFESYTTTPTAGGITTLTSAGTFIQVFTGTQTQTVKLPVASTLALGFGFLIVNRSSGIIGVATSAGNGLSPSVNIQPGASAFVFCILTSGTSAASWNVSYDEITLELAQAYTVTYANAVQIAAEANAATYTDLAIKGVFLFDNVTPIASGRTDGSEEDLFANTLTLAVFAGSKIIEDEVVTTVGSVTALRQIKKYLDSVLIFDSGSLTLALGTTFYIRTIIVIDTNGNSNVIVSVVTTSGSTIPYATYTPAFAVNYAGAPLLKTACIASGTGAAVGDIVNQFGVIQLDPPGMTVI